MFMDNPWERSIRYDAAGDGGGGGGEGDKGSADGGGEGDKGSFDASTLTMDQVRSAFPEDIRGEAMFDNIKTVQDLGKSFVHGQRLIGKKESEFFPGEDATPEQRRQFFEKIGAPTDPSGYGLNQEKFADMENVDVQYLEGLSAKAHALGLTKTQMDGLIEFQLGAIAVAQENMIGNREDAMTELKNTWGGGTERNAHLASEAVGKLGGDELKNFMNETGLGNVPLLIKAFAKVGHLLAERGLITADATGVPTQDQAHEEANKIIFDSKHALNEAYHDPQHPEHKRAVERVRALYETKFSTPLQ